MKKYYWLGIKVSAETNFKLMIFNLQFWSLAWTIHFGGLIIYQQWWHCIGIFVSAFMIGLANDLIMEEWKDDASRSL